MLVRLGQLSFVILIWHVIPAYISAESFARLHVPEWKRNACPKKHCKRPNHQHRMRDLPQSRDYSLSLFSLDRQRQGIVVRRAGNFFALIYLNCSPCQLYCSFSQSDWSCGKEGLSYANIEKMKNAMISQPMKVYAHQIAVTGIQTVPKIHA